MGLFNWTLRTPPTASTSESPVTKQHPTSIEWALAHFGYGDSGVLFPYLESLPHRDGLIPLPSASTSSEEQIPTAPVDTTKTR